MDVFNDMAMLMAAMLIGPAMYYWGIVGTIIEVILLGIGITASIKVDSIKKSYDIQTYDRIVAFMKGNDPNEIKSTKLRNIATFWYSFILVVGTFLIIVLISIYIFK